MGKVLNFGELLLRISPDVGGQWLTNNSLPVFVGGAEANVSAALALWGVPSSYMSAVPDNPLSKQIIEYLKSLNIDTSAMQYCGERIGTYYLTQGKDLKNAGVIYDRSHSSYAELKPGTIDWDKVFEGVSWFHFSAICPALTPNVAEVCREALKIASQKNITISLDLNYRAKLWKYGKEPIEVVPELATYCNLIMGNVWAANKMLGITLSQELIEKDQKEAYLKQAEITSKEILQQFPKCSAVANTFRFDYEEGVRYYTTLFADDKLLVSQEYLAKKIVGRIGSGDCYMAGLIYGFYHKLKPEETLEFATMAAFSKLFTPSDFTTTKIENMKAIIESYEG